MTCFDKTQLTIDYDVCQVAFVVIQTEASAQGQRQDAETVGLHAINLTSRNIKYQTVLISLVAYRVFDRDIK